MKNWFAFLRPSREQEKVLQPDALAAAEHCLREGQSLEDCGKLDAALELYAQAARHYPQGAGIQVCIGNVLLTKGDVSGATDCFRKAVELKPNYAAGYYCLAQASLRAGCPEAALVELERCISVDPSFSLARLARAGALEALGRWPEAIAVFRSYGSESSGEPAALLGEARCLIGSGHAQSAWLLLERATSLFPDNAEAWRLRGKLNLDMGFAVEAVANLERASGLRPTDPDYFSMLLFAKDYLPDVDPAVVFEEHRDFERRFFVDIKAQAPLASGTRSQEDRLRIGYVSGDFRDHVVARFIEPVLAHHDVRMVEIHCYHNHRGEDDTTRRLKALPLEWHDSFRLSDDQVVEQIRRAGIDILVDLSGHTEGHRLGVFARKPAPVQATWLGYLNTSGLATMDYRICDAHTHPSDHNPWMIERPARLLACQWCLPVSETLPDIGETPLLRNGYPTFGSFNNLAKLNDQVLAVWADLLTKARDARLLVMGVSPGRAADRLLNFFSSRGIEGGRLELRPRVSFAEYRLAHRETDIALDPFPYCGGTTSLDTLAMGVPLVTLAGSQPLGRGGLSLLCNLDLAELVAATPQAYVDTSLALARDSERLISLRASMRSRVLASSLTNAAEFTRDLESLYKTMWVQLGQSGSKT